MASVADLAVVAVGRIPARRRCVGARPCCAPAGFGRLLQPLPCLHPEWVGERIEKLTAALARFRDTPRRPGRLLRRRGLVQAMIVGFYLIVAYALRLDMTFWDLAVIVPISFIVQMLPVSVNGFGVREATFAFYFTRLGLPLEAALLVSLGPDRADHAVSR